LRGGNVGKKGDKRKIIGWVERPSVSQRAEGYFAKVGGKYAV